MSDPSKEESKQSKAITDSIFSAERQQDKKSKLVKDPTAEELKVKKEKEREYAVNIGKIVEEVRRDIENGGDLEESLEKLHTLEKQTRKVCNWNRLNRFYGNWMNGLNRFYGGTINSCSFQVESLCGYWEGKDGMTWF